jgi:Phasin protein
MRAQPSTSEDPQTSAGPWPSQPGWWTHATMGWVAANESAHRACVEIAAECQTFAGRRLEKDVHLLQDLISAKAPAEVWNAWSRFWQTAAEDYGAEYSTIAKLAASQSLQQRSSSEASDPRR